MPVPSSIPNGICPVSLRECQRRLIGVEGKALAGDPNKRLAFFQHMCEALRTGKTVSGRGGDGTPRMPPPTPRNAQSHPLQLWTPLLFLGSTDVWSQIRKTCAKEFAALLLSQNPADIAFLLDMTFQICKMDTVSQPGTAWYIQEGTLLFFTALLPGLEQLGSTRGRDGAPACQLSAQLLHVLVRKVLLPLSFNVQVSVRSLAHELLGRLLQAGDTYDEEFEDRASYQQLVLDTAKTTLLENIDDSSKAGPIAAVEGAVALFRTFAAPLPAGSVNAVAGHVAASIRHQAAELFALGDDRHDKQASLYGLTERVLELQDGSLDMSTRSRPDCSGGSWESTETHLMALHLFLQRTLVSHSLPSLTVGFALHLADRVATIHEEAKRFDVKRIASQLLPLAVQYAARVSSNRREVASLLQMCKDRGIVAMTNAAVLFGVLCSLRLSHGTSNNLKQLARMQRKESFRAELVSVLSSGNSDDASWIPPYSYCLIASTLLSSAELSDQHIAVLQSHWMRQATVLSGSSKEDAARKEVLDRIALTAPDFAAIHSSVVIEHLLPSWVTAIRISGTMPHVQCLLIDAIQIALKGRRSHRPFSSALTPDMQSPTFEDDPDGVGNGMLYIRKNLIAFAGHEAKPAEDIVTLLKEKDEGRQKVNGTTNSSCGIDCLKELFQAVLPSPSTEISVVTRLLQLLAACVHLHLLTATDAFELGVRQRLNQTLGSQWREHSPTGIATAASASFNDRASESSNWDDSSDDDDDWDADSSDDGSGACGNLAAASGAVEGVTFENEVTRAITFLNTLGWVAANDSSSGEALSIRPGLGLCEAEEVDVAAIVEVAKAHRT